MLAGVQWASTCGIKRPIPYSIPAVPYTTQLRWNKSQHHPPFALPQALIPPTLHAHPRPHLPPTLGVVLSSRYTTLSAAKSATTSAAMRDTAACVVVAAWMTSKRRKQSARERLDRSGGSSRGRGVGGGGAEGRGRGSGVELGLGAGELVCEGQGTRSQRVVARRRVVDVTVVRGH